MYNAEFFQLSVFTENSLHQINLTEAKVVQEKDNTTSPVEIIPFGPQFFAPIGLIIIWAITVVLFLLNVGNPQKGKLTITSTCISHQILRRKGQKL